MTSVNLTPSTIESHKIFKIFAKASYCKDNWCVLEFSFCLWMDSSSYYLLCWLYIRHVFPFSAPSIFDNKRQDPTGLTALLQSTDLVGVVHTLYCILLHSFLPESASQSQEPYGPGVIQVALQGIRFLNSFALLDLSAFQVLLVIEKFYKICCVMLCCALFNCR